MSLARYPALRAALVIARRDYVASVWSRTFLFFLVGPLMPAIAVAFFGSVGANMDRAVNHPRVALIAPAEDARTIVAAHAALTKRLGRNALPEIIVAPPARDPDRQAAALLADEGQRIFAVLEGGLDRPELTGPDQAIRETRRDLALLLDRARADRALARAGGAAPAPVIVAERPVAQAAGSDASARMLTARLGQLLLMMLTMILTGMLLSNLIEEKSNKVIEVLAAAVPLEAVFFGKLVGMFGVAVLFVAFWGTVVGQLTTLLPPAAAAAFGDLYPAVGAPMFAVLFAAYFSMAYLLLGSVFLGIGAQASTMREIQLLSLPITLVQVGMFALASAAARLPGSWVATVAEVFPLSSPFAMAGRAANSPELWPHALAILWQGVWVVLFITIGARLFRRGVLQSGSARPFWRRRVKA